MEPSPSDREVCWPSPAAEIRQIVPAFFGLSYHARVAWFAGSLYGLSLFLPTVTLAPESVNSWSLGFSAFQAGWAGVIDGRSGWDLDRLIFVLAWCLNPAVWLGIVFLLTRRLRLAGCIGGLGVAFGLVCLPRYWPYLAVLPGYWVWLSSAASLLAFGWYPELKQRDVG